MPIRGLLIGVANMEHGGFLPEVADYLEAYGKGLGASGTVSGNESLLPGSTGRKWVYSPNRRIVQKKILLLMRKNLH